MRAGDFIALQIGRQRWLADSVLQDLTEEQLNWSPPGATNTIATILLHVTGTDDTFINVLAQGRQTVWESGNWSERRELERADRVPRLSGAGGALAGGERPLLHAGPAAGLSGGGAGVGRCVPVGTDR